MSEETFNKEDVVGVECRFAVYIPPPNGSRDDYHLVKEQIHVKDPATGVVKIIPNTRLLKNWKRPFWITKEAFRNHQSKKEYEKKDRLLEFKSTQSQLIHNIARALNNPGLAFSARGQLRRIHRNQYVYGTDILSTALIKRAYKDKYPELNTRHTVATFDTETDTLVPDPRDGEIMMATVTMKTVVYTVVQKRFYEGRSDVIGRLKVLFDKYMGDYAVQRKLEWEVVIVDTEADVIVKSINKLHELKPDFVEIWNMDFDITKVIKGLEKAGIDPKDVFSDPSVPKEHRFFTYKRGPEQKVTASGKVTPIKPAARWHTVFAPCSFYVIDGMCAFRHIRNGSQEKQSYSLDAILFDTFKGKIQKLKFEEAKHLSGLPWHQFMQENYPLEYTVYNVFDCISMEMQEEKLRDISVTLPMMAGSSDYENFKSQPRRVVDELHFFVLNRNHVMGTTSDEMSEDIEEGLIGVKDWINEKHYFSII